MAQTQKKQQDMGTGDVKKLLLQLMIPAVVAQVVNLLYNIVDRIYIGHISGIGAAALTGVGLFTPILMLLNAFAMLIGSGGAPRTAIAMGQGDKKQAEKIVSNSFTMLLLFSVVLTIVFYAAAPTLLRLFGASDTTLPYALAYSRIYILGTICVLIVLGMNTFITAQGFAKISMLTTVIGAVINIVLDYVFIFILGWGMTGAALATSLGYIVGAGMILGYLGRRRNVVRLCRVKTSRKSMRLTLRNVGYMCRLGLSTFLCEGAIAMMMFAGNYVFIRYLGEDGVAAFSIACYFFPIIFMVYNAIGQSAQPILSYNFGAGNGARVRKAFRLALLTAVAAGLGFFGLTALFSRWIVAMFIDSSCPACAIAVRGLPLFASGFVFFAVNIVSIGYFQSVERPRPAMAVTVLRGFVFMAACFFGLPLLLGVEGIWLAVPLAEALTFAVVAAIYGRTRLKSAF